jgi:hypothetical protein
MSEKKLKKNWEIRTHISAYLCTNPFSLLQSAMLLIPIVMRKSKPCAYISSSKPMFQRSKPVYQPSKPAPLKAMRFVLPLEDCTKFGVASSTMRLRTSAGPDMPSRDMRYVTRPATCGEAAMHQGTAGQSTLLRKHRVAKFSSARGIGSSRLNP